MDHDVVLPVGRHPGHPRARTGEEGRQIGRRRDRGGREVVGGGEREHVDAERRAEQLLEPLVLECGGLREEGEDAPAVVVDDDDPEVDVPGRQVQQGIRVVDERQIAEQDDRRRAVEGAAERRRDDPVDPVGAPVGVRHGRAPTEPLQVTDRHRRRNREHGTVREGGRHGAGDGRLGEFRLAGQRRLDRRVGELRRRPTTPRSNPSRRSRRRSRRGRRPSNTRP